MRCGLPWCEWAWLQRLASVRLFVGLMCVVIGVQGAYLGYAVAALTSIERRFRLRPYPTHLLAPRTWAGLRFEISSSKSGLLLSLYDVGHTVAVVLVGHFGGHKHKPAWTGAGVLLSALAMLGLTLPNFIFGAASGFERELVQHHDIYVVRLPSLYPGLELACG